MKSTSQKWMATFILTGFATLLVLTATKSANAQSVLEKHLKTETSVKRLGQSSPVVPAAASVPLPNRHEDLDATLWVTFAAEYKAIARQTYVAATSQLNSAIANKDWSAIPSDSSTSDASVLEGKPARPVCVIMDVDETVLDNSGYQRELILNDSSFTGESWSQFVNKQISPPVPGAKEFVDTCRRLNVAVFFVTNRDVSLEESTRENLILRSSTTKSSSPEASRLRSLPMRGACL